MMTGMNSMNGFGSFVAVLIAIAGLYMGYRMLKHLPPFDK